MVDFVVGFRGPISVEALRMLLYSVLKIERGEIGEEE